MHKCLFVSNDDLVYKLMNIDTRISYWSSGHASNEYPRGNVCHDQSSEKTWISN